MTSTERPELFAALAELARRYPHWRFGQLVANVAGWADTEVWDVEDEQLLSTIRSHLETFTARVVAITPPDQTRVLTGAA